MVRRGFGAGIGSRIELELYSNRWTIAMITVRNSLTAPTYARGVKCWQDEMVHLRGSKFVTSNQLWRRRRGTLRIQEDDRSIRPSFMLHGCAPSSSLYCPKSLCADGSVRS